MFAALILSIKMNQIIYDLRSSTAVCKLVLYGINDAATLWQLVWKYSPSLIMFSRMIRLNVFCVNYLYYVDITYLNNIHAFWLQVNSCCIVQYSRRDYSCFKSLLWRDLRHTYNQMYNLYWLYGIRTCISLNIYIVCWWHITHIIAYWLYFIYARLITDITNID